MDTLEKPTSFTVPPAPVAECIVRIENQVPKSARRAIHTRSPLDTASGRSESVTAARFSAFVSDPSILSGICWNDVMISDKDKLYFTGGCIVVDEDTWRLMSAMEVIEIDEDVLVGLPSIMNCRATVVTCHNCAKTISVHSSGPASSSSSSSAEVFVCNGCNFARYCSESCAVRAWEREHHLTCSNIKRRLNRDPAPTTMTGVD
jgi:hypothetical protein